MKITFILPRASLSGGIRVVATYARELIALGHDVTVVSNKNYVSPLRHTVRKLRYGSKIMRKRKTDLLDFLGPRHISLDQTLPESLAKVPKGDIVVATWWQTAEWVGTFPEDRGRKVYLLQDYEMFDYLPCDRVAATYHLPMIKLAVSGYIRDEIAQNHGVNDVAVLPNSVDLDQFNTPPRSKNGALTVGFLYTPNPRKRAALAVEAVCAARAQIPGLRVLAFGSKPPKETTDIPDWIDYHVSPPQAEIPKLYASCDLWLFSSEAEGFGLPLLEAMACRTPVLATRAGAAPDLIDGQNGVLVDGTAESFAAEITRFDQMSAQAWRALSDAAWQTAHGYSWKDATARLLTHFGEN